VEGLAFTDGDPKRSSRFGAIAEHSPSSTKRHAVACRTANSLLPMIDNESMVILETSTPFAAILMSASTGHRGVERATAPSRRVVDSFIS
jgi:hypothetical protein